MVIVSNWQIVWYYGMKELSEAYLDGLNIADKMTGLDQVVLKGSEIFNDYFDPDLNTQRVPNWSNFITMVHRQWMMYRMLIYQRQVVPKENRIVITITIHLLNKEGSYVNQYLNGCS